MSHLDGSVAAEIYAHGRRLEQSGAQPLRGTSSANWIIEHPTVGRVLVRRPRNRDRRRLVRASTEASLLGALGTRLDFVPRVLHVAENLDQIHEAKPGTTVTSLGTPPPGALSGIMTDHLAGLSEFPLSDLPARLLRRLDCRDVRVFAAELLDEAHAAWDRAEAVAPGVSAVYARLGAGPQRLLAARVPIARLHFRRLGVVHADLHPGNILATVSGRTRFVTQAALVDWEFGRIGDPLYDFVRHTISTEYPDEQLAAAQQSYQDKASPAIRAGMAEDWPTYSRINLARRNAFGTVVTAKRLRDFRNAAARRDRAVDADVHRLARQEAERLSTEQRDHREPEFTAAAHIEREFRRYVFGDTRRPAMVAGLSPIIEAGTQRSPEREHTAHPAPPGISLNTCVWERTRGRQPEGLRLTKDLSS